MGRVAKKNMLREFDEGGVCAIAFTPSQLHDAEVATLAIAKTGADGVEQFVDGCAGHQIGEGLAAGGEIATLTERDHLFDQRTHGFCFGQSGFDALFQNERGDQVAKQRAAVGSVAAQCPSCNFVAHVLNPSFEFQVSSFRLKSEQLLET